VPTHAERFQAEKDARSIPGVRIVDNQLHVTFLTGENIPSDDEIATVIRNFLLWNPNIDPQRINVDVKNGRVTLSGTVDTNWQKSRAGDMAAPMRGVCVVDNNLSVEPKTDVSDATIKRDIEEALKRSSDVDEDRIHAGVDNKIVTLTGKVRDLRESYAAEDIALYTRGVTVVKNGMTVGHAEKLTAPGRVRRQEERATRQADESVRR